MRRGVRKPCHHFSCIVWISPEVLSIKPQWTKFNGIWIKVQTISGGKVYLKISSPKYQPFWPGLICSWWRHQIETFSALLAICVGNSPVTGEFPTQRPVTRSFDVLFDLRQNKRLSKQWEGWWFATPSCPLWCYCNVCKNPYSVKMKFSAEPLCNTSIKVFV